VKTVGSLWILDDEIEEEDEGDIGDKEVNGVNVKRLKSPNTPVL
jgi:hypothetical protein